MYPYLFDLPIFGFHLKPPTYGVLLATAFSTAYFLSIWRAARLGEEPKHIENLFLVVVLSSVVGSRMFHVLFEEPQYYWAHPSKIFAIWEGGYTFYGALLAAILGIFIYVRIHKMEFLQIGDIAAPATALGLFIGRIGCFAAGCCWGRAATVSWAVTFSRPDSFCDLRNTPLHPTQLYESFGALLLFFYLQWRFRNRKYVGQIFFEGICCYSVLRFIIEYFRGDEYRGYVLHGLISYSQAVSLALLPFGLMGILWFTYRDRVLK